MKTNATFKQVDVERAIKAAQKAGLKVEVVEITRDGTIRILTGKRSEYPEKQHFVL